MKVIFLQSVPRVGKKDEVKEVNDGYATNFLFPKKLAEPATAKAVASLEMRKKEIAIESVDAMKKEHRADISEEFIALEKSIKQIGEFEIPIEIKGKKSSFKLIVERI